jgi:hypothetical protein
MTNKEMLAACMREEKNTYKYSYENLKEKVYLECLGIDASIILKYVLKK